MLDSQEGTANVGVVGFLPKIQWSLPDWVIVTLVSNARIGYQDIDWTKMVFGFLEA